MCVRTGVARREAGPLQLDLFVPHDRGYEFKVIVTNEDSQHQCSPVAPVRSVGLVPMT